MVYSLIARIIERIPTIKDLLKRLREDVLFRLDCGFSLAESIPSASTYSRLIQKLSQSEALEEISQNVIKLAFEEGFIPDDTVAIDATHIEARDRAPKKQEQQKSIYEKKIADQLDVPYKTLREQMPITPEWGVKCNSEGKNLNWYGYKGHLAVATQSQYILGALLSSGSMNDGKAAIPLLKGLQAQFPTYRFSYATMDAGYDYEPIYEEVRKSKAHAITAYNRRREPEMEGQRNTKAVP